MEHGRKMQAKPYCDKMRRHFDDCHDGELSPFLRTVVRKHLKDCGPCRREFTLLERTVEIVRGKEAPSVPARLLKKVIKDLSTGGKGGTPERRRGTAGEMLGGLQGGV